MTDATAPERPYRDIAAALLHYLRVFVTSATCWVILARNLIPAAGVFVFGWELPLVVFNYWFDGVVALVALIIALFTRIYRDPRQVKSAGAVVLFVVVGAILIGMFGIPYWLLLFDDKQGELALLPTLRQVAVMPALLATFVVSAAVGLWRMQRSWIAGADIEGMGPRFKHELSVAIGRGLLLGMFLALRVPLAIVPLMALAITILEAVPILEPSMVEPDPPKQADQA